ncbi:MAG: prepilin-type N-terminal cleavage/methylation domain-containing protein [Chloroflexota bacterium]|nr:prepilin-type N-terminal cleavage/methylation domain-containing protein [Chloroflexota bacterium]
MVHSINKWIGRGTATGKRQHGFTLAEVVIALAVLSIVSGSFLAALSVSTKAVSITRERNIGESLSQSQMEFVLNAPYDDSLEDGHPYYDLDPDINITSGYTINSTAERLDPLGMGPGKDYGIQEITVEVLHGDKLIVRVQGYKARHE